MVQIREDPRVVVPSPVPGKGRVFSVGREHCSKLEQVQKMLESAIDFSV